jgi:creatinine amidohydrolase
MAMGMILAKMKRMPGLFIDSLTWPEVEAAFRSYDTMVVPVGAHCKEHGPHLPLNTDWVYAGYLTRRVVQACRVLAVPTLGYAYYPAFTEYPGSVNIGAATFREGIRDLCRSFARHGIRKFYVLNTGISTVDPLACAREALAVEGVRMEFCDLRDFAVAARESVEQQPLGTHADEIETSNMLYVAPNLVHMDRARPELAPNRPGGLTRDPDATTGVFSSSGAWGDPTLATAEKGRIVTEAIVEQIVDFLRREFLV